MAKVKGLGECPRNLRELLSGTLEPSVPDALVAQAVGNSSGLKSCDDRRSLMTKRPKMFREKLWNKSRVPGFQFKLCLSVALEQMPQVL